MNSLNKTLRYFGAFLSVAVGLYSLVSGRFEMRGGSSLNVGMSRFVGTLFFVFGICIFIIEIRRAVFRNNQD